MSRSAVRLWSDEPSPVDLLAFGAVAETAVEAVLDDVLDPIALGISGPWGSGKSTVLKLIESELESRSDSEQNRRILIVASVPWRYDPAVGAKATLIGEVLSALDKELQRCGGVEAGAKSKLNKLAKRVNWVKALKLAARTSITLQLPGIEDISGLVSEGDINDDPEPRTLDEFRQEFAKLLDEDDFAHVQRVVVLVDDLDRCLPETVVDTLETMRLFLSVPKMSFVIAADEDRVADSVRDRYPKDTEQDVEAEEPARLYLHKIVQTTLRLPALSRFDTEAFLLLLLLQNRPDNELEDTQFDQILQSCTELRTAAGAVDSVAVPSDVDIASEMQFAARLTPMLYEKLRGSPRRIKRFLNDLNVRASIAGRRGIELDFAIVAKLMILELLLPKEFSKVLDWLAQGELRSRLTQLEEMAGRKPKTVDPLPEGTETPEDENQRKPSKKIGGGGNDAVVPDSSDMEIFSESFVRWAKLPPSLDGIDLSPYLHLAASFAGTPLVDAGLPERLRDVAANLLSSSRAAQKSVIDNDISTLLPDEAQVLVEHLGRMGRDRPGVLMAAVGAILRISKIADISATAENALRSIPSKDIKPPLVLLFGHEDVIVFKDVLDRWAEGTDSEPVRRAIAGKLKSKAKT